MRFKIALFLFLMFCVNTIIAQTTSFGDNLNTITTAVPFITISPDARAGSMGEVGAATIPDIHSLHWNPAKLAFLQDQSGLAMSYTPWLSQLVPDISLAYLTGYSKINKNSAWSAALRYFSLGNIQFTNESGEALGTWNPNEYTFDIGYGMKFNNNFSGGVAMRYIYSNLTGGQYVGELQTEPGTAFAVDLSTYYESDFIENNQWALGMNISNIGTKISYTEDDIRDFLPMNFKIGGRYTRNIDQYNSLSVSIDINKLLVPTPPIYAVNEETGQPAQDENGNLLIEAGQDPNVSVISGIFQSFGDAPGGLSEEWRELMYSIGFEYWYQNQFAFRGGYFHEHATKGNRKYFTLGAGLKMNVFALDFAYLITASPDVKSPLENTMRFSLIFDIGAFTASAKDGSL
jgi:hypothetical protein|tara:strand:+ start:1490 stop:2698 length:1209 start_codon:yes stop_codon:yes gene_type:complete